MPLAKRLRQIFVELQIETVIDVGANEGQYRNFLRSEVGFAGKIESFEPLPRLAEQLRLKAITDPHWSVHARALGAAPGELTLNVMSSTDFSSFLNPLHRQNDDPHYNEVIGSVVVPVSTIDAEFGGRPDLARTYLKLDTQGYDLEVLRGAERIIRTIPALQTEVSFIPIYGGMPDYKEALSTLERHGFQVADFFLVSKDQANRAIEFDCIMVNVPKP